MNEYMNKSLNEYVSSLEPEDTDIFTHLLSTTYRVAAGSIAVNKNYFCSHGLKS